MWASACWNGPGGVLLEQPVGNTHERTPPRPSPRDSEDDTGAVSVADEPDDAVSASAPAPAEPWACALPDTAAEAMLFPTSSHALHERGTKILDELVACERAGGLGDYRLRVVGFTDPRGSEAWNQALGLDRARAVARYLLRHGMPEERLMLDSVGENHALGTGPESWYYDRRVEITLVEPRAEPAH